MEVIVSHDNTLQCSSMSGRRSSLCNGVSSLFLSGNPSRTIQSRYSSSFRQCTGEFLICIHACCRSLCKTSCHPQREPFLSFIDCKNRSFVCQGWCSQKPVSNYQFKTICDSIITDYTLKRPTIVSRSLESVARCEAALALS
jgi:hypothetical protein